MVLEMGCEAMKRNLPETPRVYDFRYATTRRNHDGFEFMLVAKSMDDLKRSWTIAGGDHGKFDETKVNFIQIKRG